MPARPTAGYFLGEAASHLRQAAAAETPARRAAWSQAAAASGQVTAALARFAGDSAPGWGPAEPGVARLAGWPRTVVDAYSALGRAAVLLQAAAPPSPSPADDSTLASSLTAAARSLTVGRDLLHTHFTHDAAGRRIYASEWAPVLSSPAGTRAIAGEVSWYSAALAPIVSRLAREARPGQRHTWLEWAAQLLWDAANTIRAEQLRDPPPVSDLEVLHAIPLNDTPRRVLPTGAETLGQLCEGTISTAERARHAAWQPRPGWDPDTSGAALRSAAAAGVVTSHNCGTALALLAQAARGLGNDRLSATLESGAHAAAAAQRHWLTVARAWGEQVVTDTDALQPRARPETSDLATWTGRIVYTDPQWAPAHGRATELRQPTDLAPDDTAMRAVITAVHQATETLHGLAAAGHDQVHAMAAKGRLHSPTRSLPAWTDIPRAYGPVPKDRITGLLASYQAAAAASAHLAAQAGEAAMAAGAPSRTLAAAKQITGRAFAARSGPPAPPARLPACPPVGAIWPRANTVQPAPGPQAPEPEAGQ